MQRPSGRSADALRPVQLIRHYTRHAEGSVLVCFGDTKVLCTASVDDRPPPFLRGTGQGWVTAEYAMLPRATTQRTTRDISKGKLNGRAQEIQRLIGRSLRAAVDRKLLGECQILIDCDVIQADGGTRTAAITGAYVALADAIAWLRREGKITTQPLVRQVAAVSVGLYAGAPVLDLDYAEDANAGTDMNVVMNDAGGFIELQGTAEDGAFTDEQLSALLGLARSGIQSLHALQREALEQA